MKNLDQSLSNKGILDESFSNVSGRLTNYSSKISSLKSEITSISDYINSIKNKIIKINELTDSINSAKNDLSRAEANLSQAKAMGALSNIALIKGNIAAINSKISSLQSELSLIGNKSSLESDLARKYELLDQKKQDLNSMLIGDKGVKPIVSQEFKEDMVVFEKPRENPPYKNDLPERLDVNTVSESVKTSSKKSIKDMFTVKNAAIIVVVVGLALGILKYKKII